VLAAFEAAEREPDHQRQRAWLTFVVVGAGPTGVELAGALAELAHHTLRGEYRTFDPGTSRIALVEGGPRVLPAFHPTLSAKARRSLERLGVDVLTETFVSDLDADGVTLKRDGRSHHLATHVVLWAAGVRAVALSTALAAATGCALDDMGRVVVGPDLAVPGHPDVFVIGDLARVLYRGQPVPAMAPAAMQQGRYVARLVRARLAGRTRPPFAYFHKGSLATVGHSSAVAGFGPVRLWGLPAWLLWLFVHLLYLIEFENRLLVLIQWANNYLTRHRGSRLITGDQ
jgi:NADH dehydrogenase